jgi:predicted ATP-binding protein involved in virulence
MITRLRVNGFKNLRDVDIHFSEFTCIVGTNGAGKSNLFDAIQFLSLSASKTLLEASLAIRTDGAMSSDPSHIFCFDQPIGKRRIDFKVDMIVPKNALDERGTGENGYPTSSGRWQQRQTLPIFGL